MPKRLQPDNPVEWLNRAKSSLSLARQQSHEIYREDLCYQAQQAAEKAVKAVYISKNPCCNTHFGTKSGISTVIHAPSAAY
ncbi:MAG: HEPN domain-containing protein [Methanoregula sp.]